MEGRLLLDVVVGQSPSVLQLLAGEDEPLLVRGDALLVLNLGLHILDAIASLDLQGDGLASEGLHKNLHTSPKPEDEMEGGLFLDVGLHVLDAIASLDLQGDGLAGQSLDENLHTTSQSEDEMEGGLFLDVVVGQSPSVLQLLASEDQPLLVRGDALLVLDLGLH